MSIDPHPPAPAFDGRQFFADYRRDLLAQGWDPVSAEVAVGLNIWQLRCGVAPLEGEQLAAAVNGFRLSRGAANARGIYLFPLPSEWTGRDDEMRAYCLANPPEKEQEGGHA